MYNMLLTKVTDAEGNSISFTYDKYGNMLTSSKPYKAGDSILYDSYSYYINYVDTTDVAAGVKSKTYTSFVDGSQENLYAVGMEKRTSSPLGVVTTSYTDNNDMNYKTTVQDGCCRRNNPNRV